MRKGFFIVFEGVDRCGKSTQARLLTERYRSQGLPVVLTREPGGTPLGENVRRLLLETKDPVDALSELLLYEASRAQHVAQVIKPALEAGSLVISDRFTLATEAYQGYGRHLALARVRQLNRLACQGISPDQTFILDVPLSVSLQRLGDQRDRMEQQTSFLRQASRAYQLLAKTSKRYCKIVADRSVEELHQEIFGILEKLPSWQRWKGAKLAKIKV